MNKFVKIAAGAINVAFVVAATAAYALNIRDLQVQENLSTISSEDRMCLSQNIFFEARNQTIAGQVAVAWVTLNRMEASDFPMDICDVVRQGKKDKAGNMIRHKCQFSWYCDGKSDIIPSNPIAQRAWEDAQLIADVVLLDWARREESPVADATFYHADYVSPYWANKFTEVAVVDDHIFYVN